MSFCSRRKLSSGLVINPAHSGKMSSVTETQPAELRAALCQSGRGKHSTSGWDCGEGLKGGGRSRQSTANTQVRSMLPIQTQPLIPRISAPACGKPRGCPGCSESLGVPVLVSPVPLCSCLTGSCCKNLSPPSATQAGPAARLSKAQGSQRFQNQSPFLIH